MLVLKNRTIASFLPVFNGFYGTYFEPDEEHIIEEPYSYENYSFDYDSYRKNVAQDCVTAIENKLIDLGLNGIKITFENVSSPAYYNYGNDSINVTYKLTPQGIKAINTYLKDNKEAYSEYIKERYTSRSGFASFYDNDADVWLGSYLKDAKQLEHCFGALLEFIFENEKYTHVDLHSEVYDKSYLEGWLNDDVTSVINEIEAYTKNNYNTKDLVTLVCDLVKYFKQPDTIVIGRDYLTFDYIENKVKDIFDEIEGNTLSLFAQSN
ncbi:MAG: hypothetical protein AABY22_12090 [Nanoarchaeota archaeon]